MKGTTIGPYHQPGNKACKKRKTRSSRTAARRQKTIGKTTHHHALTIPPPTHNVPFATAPISTHPP